MQASLYQGNRKLTISKCVEVPPKKSEVKIKISYCGICGTDLHIYHGNMDSRVNIPHIMGHECSGVVSEIGEEVKDVKIGDKVVVRPLRSCGKCAACLAGDSHICYNLDFLGIETNGAMQSYWTVPAETIHKIPDNMSLKYGALIEPLAVVCHDVRISGLVKGEKVVIIGGGPIGILAALVAKNVGADVLISEINEYRVNFAKKLGLNTINPKELDIEEYVNEWTGGAGADVVFEVSASKAGASIMTKLLRARGRIVAIGIYSNPPEVDLKQFFLRELKLFGARVYEIEDYENAIQLASTGELPLESIITKVAPLKELQEVLEGMTTDQQAMKILIDCQ